MFLHQVRQLPCLHGWEEFVEVVRERVELFIARVALPCPELLPEMATSIHLRFLLVQCIVQNNSYQESDSCSRGENNEQEIVELMMTIERT